MTIAEKILEKETTFSCFKKSAALINSFGFGGRESKGDRPHFLGSEHR